MNDLKLKSKALADWLALLPPLTVIAAEAGISPLRLKNLKLGRVKSLTAAELEAVQAALAAWGFNLPDLTV